MLHTFSAILEDAMRTIDVASILAMLEKRRLDAEETFSTVSKTDKNYYAGMCAAYTLVIVMLQERPGVKLS